jgi:AcrR family transcriptional regulator
MAADRRVQRTQSALQQALMSLMASRGYRGISVDALLERAKVARSTFYAHFRGKDGLLRDNIRRLRAIVSDADTGGVLPPEQRLLHFNRAFFRHVHDNRNLYLALLRDPDRGAAVFRKMQDLLAEVAADELGKIQPACDRELVETAVQFLVGAQWSVMAWWLERRPGLSAESAHERFERLAMPVLTTLRG